MSKQEVITIKCECTDCEGTGLYVGLTCHDGAAMVCRSCKGTGCVEFSYTPFTSRKRKEGIKRIFEAVPRRHFYPSVHTFDNGKTVDYSQFGCTVEEWENGVTPKPLPDKI